MPEGAYEPLVCARAQSFQSLKPGGAASISTIVELVIRARKDSAARIPASSLSAAMMPFARGGAPEPTVNGYLEQDRTYSAGGRALNRASVRSY